MPQQVTFTAMDHATRDDYDLVFAHDAENIATQAGRVVSWLQKMDGDSPYQISRLDHCLQTATRAERDGADEETIVCALLHDIGDVIAPANHSQAAAALLREVRASGVASVVSERRTKMPIWASPFAEKRPFAKANFP